MFDDAFIEMIEQVPSSTKKVEQFDQWIKHWGVHNVVANSGRESQIGEKKHWMAVLLFYFPSMHQWATSQLCSQSDADYVFKHLYPHLILHDNEGVLAQKCAQVFSQKMFHSNTSILGSMKTMAEENKDGLLEHVFHHSNAQKHLCSTAPKSQKGLQELFSAMIVSSRTTPNGAWKRFRANPPPFHHAWLTPYINTLLHYNFTDVIAELLSNPTFERWEERTTFLPKVAQNHTLNISNYVRITFLDTPHLPQYYGKVVWNSIECGAFDTNKIYAALEHMSAQCALKEILVGCFDAAERSVKGLGLTKKHEKLLPYAGHMRTIVERIDEHTLAYFAQIRPKSYQWMNLHNHPRVLQHVLNAVVCHENTQQRKSKI